MISHARPLIVCIALSAAASSAIQAAELFVADRTTNRILSFDETTGAFLRIVTDTGLDVPTGITFGPGGFLYASNLQSGFPGAEASVVKIDPVTGATTPFITDVLGSGGIAYHAASDTLFVSEFGNFDGDEVFRYNADGTLLQTLGTGSAATGRTGMTFDAAGNLYVNEANFTLASASPSSVLKFDAPVGLPTNNFGSVASTFASGATVTLSFPVPASGFNGLSFGLDGNLYVASLLGQAIIKYTVSEGAVTDGTQFGAIVPYPAAMLLESDGNLLVTSLGNNNPGDPIYGNSLFPGNVLRIVTSVGTSDVLIQGGSTADLNGDSSVNGGDLEDWQAAYGLDASGDIDGDEDTDGGDFLAWQRAYGIQLASQPTGIARYVPLVETIAVPEPSTLCLILLGAATAMLNRQSSIGRNER